jgi:hypothetical protein
MPASDLSVTWTKSRHSNPNGNCVEMARLPGGDVAVRNSRYPGGPALIFTRSVITAFLTGIAAANSRIWQDDKHPVTSSVEQRS